jgi:hypothetical protein
MLDMTKLAAPDQEFEQGFFQLAFDKLQSKLYNLLPYFVGFELVKKSDDGSKAIGVFGFKSDNGQIILVPSFFINGKVKELDTMYSRNNNQFYPLNEDYAELFLKDDVTGLGGVSAQNRKDIMKDLPPTDFRDMAIPPRTGRQVVASVLDYIEESDNNVKKAFWEIMEKNADFTEAVRRFYPDEKIAKALMPNTKQEAVPKSHPVKVVKFPFVSTTEGLSEEQKKDAITKGYTVLDHRKTEEKSKFGVINYSEKFSNPQDSGFYTYLTAVGTLRYGLVLIKPCMLHNGFSTDNSIVVDLESSTPGKAYKSDDPIFIKDQIKVQDYSAVHKLMEDPSEGLPSFSNVYILINDSLKCTEPFRITQNFKDSNGIRRLQVEPDISSPACDRALNKAIRDEYTRDIALVFTKKGGDKLEFRGTSVYVPKSFKLLQLRFSNYVDMPYDSSDPEGYRKKKQEEENRIKEGKPGRLFHLTELLMGKNVLPMSVHTNGSEYFVNIPSVKKKYANPLDAKIGMILDFGLDDKIADELIDGLIPDIVIDGHVKLGVLGDQTLSLMDETPQADDFGNPTYYGTPYQNQLPRSDGYTGDPTRKGTAVMPDVHGIDYEVGKAVEMANAGQKEIFDTQAIATIAKYTDPTNKVMTYVPTFVSSLDKLGRMLFMIYWETDKFQEMYGEDELPELIELLKSVFKNLGDLIIFLKRKFPDISINANEQGMDKV